MFLKLGHISCFVSFFRHFSNWLYIELFNTTVFLDYSVFNKVLSYSTTKRILRITH